MRMRVFCPIQKIVFWVGVILPRKNINKDPATAVKGNQRICPCADIKITTES
jgi:hypothetical protein